MAVAIALVSTRALAQAPRGFVEGAGGFAVSPDATSGDVVGQAGIRIARNLLVVGDIGRFRNLQPSTLSPAVDATTALLSTQDLQLTGTARVPAWYALGGVRYEMPMGRRLTPYVFAGGGFARLTPTAQFLYSSGTLPGATPVPGDDVTSQIVALGDFTQPAATTKPMIGLGGGVELPIERHLALDVGYRWSRVHTDTPVNAQSVTFGLGVRF